MGVILKNNATSTITTAISASDVGLAVSAGTGSLFPTLGASDYFYATLVSSGGTYEVIKVTARVGDTMTIVRAQEGTTAQSFVSGSRIEVRVTAASITDMVDEHDQASEISFAPTGSVSATDVQAAIAELDTEKTTLAAVLARLDDSDGSSLVGHISTGTGAVSTTVQAVLRSIAVTPQQYLAAGESLSNDAGPAIRRAIASGLPVRFPLATYVVNYDPASAFDDGGTTRYSYCIQVPSNTTLIFDQGATIQGKAGLQSWTRIITFTNSANFRVFGELKVDANVANRGTPTNEHMHGVFFFDASNFYVEAIDSRNARADNVYFGGTDNTRGSCDGYVGRIVAKVAGRKNLVWQAFDNLHIGSADLDNSAGGAAIYGGVADTTDGNCFDVEPDSWTGAIFNRGQIDYLRTKGAGNDFTAGTTAAQGDAMVVSIGDWVCEIVPRTNVPWYGQYAITLNVNKMLVTGITATSATAELFYGARLNVDQMDIRGARTDATTPFMIIAYNTAAPVVEINKLSVQGLGVGFENRDGLVTIGNYKARTGGAAFWNRGLSGTANVLADTMIDTLDLLDVGQPSGAGYAFLVSITTNAQSCRIGHIRFRDTRSPKLNFVGYSGSGASAGVFIGTIDNNTTVPLIGYVGTDTFYRVAGGVGTAGEFVVTGTPEAKITAPIGSIARRTDGGAATSFYIKESGTGNTGWVGK
jgi:hypothetical protein